VKPMLIRRRNERAVEAAQKRIADASEVRA